MASITQADASASSHAALPPGLMLPVQALTTGFVHDALSLPLNAAQTPLVAPLPTVGTPTTASAGVSGAAAGPFATQAAAEAASAVSGTGGVLSSGASSDAALFAGAAQPASSSLALPAVATLMDSAASVANNPMLPGVGSASAMPVHAAPATAGMAAYGPAVFAPGAVADDTQSRQGVRIGDVGVMLTYEDSSELTDLPELYYLPNAPVWVKGLANLHGNLVPVFDVAQYLGVQCGDQAAGLGHAVGANKPMLLVLGHGADAAGIVIEGIPQRLVPMPQQQTDTDTAPALLMPHIQGAYFINEQLWFDLNCSSLLDMLEQAMMQQA